MSREAGSTTVVARRAFYDSYPQVVGDPIIVAFHFSATLRQGHVSWVDHRGEKCHFNFAHWDVTSSRPLQAP